MDLSPVGLLTWYFIWESTLKMTLNYVIKTMTILAFDLFFTWFQSPSLAQVKIEEAKRELVSILINRLIRDALSVLEKKSPIFFFYSAPGCTWLSTWDEHGFQVKNGFLSI